MADNDNNLVFTVSSDMTAAQRGLNKFVGDIGTATDQIAKKYQSAGAKIDSATTALQTRINGVVGLGTKATKEWTGALADQGKELERLRAQYNPLFAAQQGYSASVRDIERAHALGALSADEMTAALNREKLAFASQVTAIKARNAALADSPANNNRRGGSFQTANIAAQFQDIGVTAAMGMNPLQIALQQGTQLSSVLGTMGSGKDAIAGLGAAFASLLSPISLATIGLVAGSAALIQYFTAGEDGASKTTPLIEKQNEIIRDAATAWGEALPSVTKVVDQLDRAKQISTGREAGDILGAKALEGLGEKLEGINRQFSEAMRGLRGIGADPAFIRDFGKAFSNLKERLDSGTASISDINGAQQMLATAVDQYGVKSVLGFRDAFEKITESIQKSIEASKQAREEWVKALAGATSVQDITSGATFRDENGKTHQTGTFTPTVGPTPQSRPLIELEGMPGADKANKQAETAATKAANAYRDLLKSADDRLGQMQQEIELLGKYGVAADAARFRLDLLQQSEDKGRSLNAEQRAAIEQKVALYGQYADVLSKTKLQQDLVNQARFSSLSKEDQQITTMLRQYGRPEDLTGDDAKQIRGYLRSEDLRGDLKSFAGDFKNALLNNGGDIGEAFANAIQNAALNQLSKLADKLIDQLVNAILGSTGGGASAASGGGGIGAAIGSAISGVSGKAASSIAVNSGAAGGVDLAQKLIGQNENTSASSINSFLKQGGVDLDAAQQAWCAAFVNSSLEQVGVKGSGSNVANSFLNWGSKVDPSQILRGDVLVQNRGLGANQTGGHVGFATGASRLLGGQQQIEMLSGNLNDSVGKEWVNAMSVQARRATDAAASLGKVAGSAADATQGLGQFGNGLGQLGSNLSSAGSKGGGGGFFDWLTGLFSGGVTSGGPASSAFNSRGYADGGQVAGPGGPTSDSIPAMLSDGEFVINAASARKHRRLLEAINSGSVARLARGGLVSTSVAPSGRNYGGGDKFEVNIINSNGSQVSKKERKTSSGKALDVFIDDMVADKMSKPGSRSRGAVQSQFGLKNGLAKR